MPLSRGKLFAVFLVILCVGSSCGSFDGTVTVYPVGKFSKTDTETHPLNRTVYKVSFETQTVVYWMPGLYEVPERLVNCKVRDKYNWQGEYPDHSGEVKMVDGVIINDDPDVKYVSSIYWHYLNSKGKF